MQRAIFQPTTITPFQTQATRVLPGHGTGADGQVVNDDIYDDKNALLREVLSILVNVVGGALLLSGMLILPYVIGWILS
jgi:hypothetical protein